MRKSTTFSAYSTKFLTLFTPFYWLAVVIAFFLFSRDWTILRATTGSLEQLFGLLGFSVFFLILIFAYADARTFPVLSLRNLFKIGMPTFVCLFFLFITVELSQKSWDYKQYETAFRAVVAGDNPYLSTRYLYPPLFAQGMAFIYRIGTWLLPTLGVLPRDISPWIFVFYIHQSMLLYAILLCNHLSLRFAERIGIGEVKALIFVSGLFLLNVPILRTILYNQVNFYILTSILIAMLTLTRYPILSGLWIAFGGLIKLYPLVLIAPLLTMKKWKALASVIASLTCITAILTNGFRDLLLWKQFVHFYLSFPVERESAWFRNTSILSLLRNSLDLMGMPPELVTPIFGIVSLSILAWIALRFLQRERIYTQAIGQGKSLPLKIETYRNIGHLIDFSVISLLIAPSAWEHHFVIAIPLAIWTFAFCGRENFWSTTISLIFVFMMPVFNIYPFSYLRLAGLFALLILASPANIQKTKEYNRYLSPDILLPS